MSTLKKVKRYEELNFSQWTALATKLGGLANVKDIIMGRKEVSIIDKLPLLIDKNGQIIPSDKILGEVVEVDLEFSLYQPNIDYDAVIKNLDSAYSTFSFAKSHEFKNKVDSVWERVKSNPSLKNLDKTIFLPICLPWIPGINSNNYFRIIEQDIEPIIRRLYGFDGKIPMSNSHKELISISELSMFNLSTRYEKLLSLVSDGPVVGLFLPDCLRGYPVASQRQQIELMPENMFLTGMLEYFIAISLYKETFTRSFEVPSFDMSVVQYQNENVFLRLSSKTFSINTEKNSEVGCSTSSGGILII